MSNKEILIIGPDFYGYNESVAKAFEFKGFKTSIINFQEENIPVTGNKLVDKVLLKAKRSHYINEYGAKVNKEIIEFVSKNNIKNILVIKGSYITRETLEYLKAKGCKLIMWMMDSVYRESQSMDTLELYDYRFMFEKTDIKKLKDAKGIDSYFLPLCYDNYVYDVKDIERNVDISFVGSFANYEHRVALFERIIEEFKDCNIEIYGKYLMPSKPERYSKYYLKGYRKYFKNRFLTPEEVSNLYSRSKICINIHNKQSKEGCNPRFFEIIGTKSFELVDNIEYINKNFNDYTVIYKDTDDLIRLIRYYLENEKERQEVVEKGYKYISSNHTFINRIEEIISICDLCNE